MEMANFLFYHFLAIASATCWTILIRRNNTEYETDLYERSTFWISLVELFPQAAFGKVMHFENKTFLLKLNRFRRCYEYHSFFNQNRIVFEIKVWIFKLNNGFFWIDKWFLILPTIFSVWVYLFKVKIWYFCLNC